MFSPAGVRKEVMDNYRLTTKLEFKDDKTWTSPSSSGSYTITNDKFVAKTLVVMNRDIVRDGLTAYYPDTTGELSADGSYLTVHFPNTNNDSAFKDVKMVPDN